MLAAAEMDVDFYEGVLDGSFDSSKDTLIRALGRIVQKEDELNREASTIECTRRERP
jgi:hypothetical protein